MNSSRQLAMRTLMIGSGTAPEHVGSWIDQGSEA